MKLNTTKLVILTFGLLFLSTSKASLDNLEAALKEDLERINYPPRSWRPSPSDDNILDVAIIGGGMAGLAATFALLRQGITNIGIFDENYPHQEGPWLTTARMKTLRSGKQLMGPALFLPNLTFHAWYEAKYDAEAWRTLGNPPNGLWMDYLIWYQRVLELPLKSNYKLHKIIPDNHYLELTFATGKEFQKIRSRKVVLATGRAGFGGLQMPFWVKTLNPCRYAHTNQIITKQLVQNKRIVIVGCGASAFDAAGYALENGALTVTMLSKRTSLPAINKFATFNYPGLNSGFYSLSDHSKWLFFEHAFSSGIPAPKDSLDRVKTYENFSLLFNREITSAVEKNNSLECVINYESIECDFIILATGFAIDGTRQKELEPFIDKVLLWKDKITSQENELKKKMGRFPYLGAHFEFLEKKPGDAPYLKNIHCFNYAASLSHGLISSDIPAISIGALRLAEGIAADLFVVDSQAYLENLYEYAKKDFDDREYSFIQ